LLAPEKWPIAPHAQQQRAAFSLVAFCLVAFSLTPSHPSFLFRFCPDALPLGRLPPRAPLLGDSMIVMHERGRVNNLPPPPSRHPPPEVDGTGKARIAATAPPAMLTTA
jgi:hypothetical protein